MSKWIKKDDKVVVIAGNDKGKVGTVVKRSGDRVVIQGVNIRKKHAKRQNPAASKQILEMEMPIHISNVSLCDTEGKAIKVKVRENKQGKELFYLQGDKEVVLRSVRKNS